MSYGQLAMDKCYCCDFKTKSEIKNELTVIVPSYDIFLFETKLWSIYDDFGQYKIF